MSKKNFLHVSVYYQLMDATGTYKRSRGITYVRPTQPRRAMRKAMGISARTFRKMGLNREFQ